LRFPGNPILKLRFIESEKLVRAKKKNNAWLIFITAAFKAVYFIRNTVDLKFERYIRFMANLRKFVKDIDTSYSKSDMTRFSRRFLDLNLKFVNAYDAKLLRSYYESILE
jgi:hypothetical protein